MPPIGIENQLLKGRTLQKVPELIGRQPVQTGEALFCHQIVNGTPQDGRAASVGIVLAIVASLPFKSLQA
jgi:hypothetical protein